MADGKANIIEELERLRDLTSSDFVALAPFIENTARMRWKYVVGNSNDRFQQMVIKIGQGLAGAALRLGRWVKIDDTHSRVVQERRECPVMLAEQLQSAVVFPLITPPNSKLRGLLFIGKRMKPRYEENEISAAQEVLEMLVLCMEENTEKTAK